MNERDGLFTGHTRALSELAQTLGARPAQIEWRVHLPLARGLLGVCRRPYGDYRRD